MKVASGNVVFVDTEFSDLDPYKGELLSVGMVKADGQELYLELEHAGEVSDWVRENILATLDQPKLARGEVRRRIAEFVGERKPFMISYVNQYDAIYLYKLFVGEENPFLWLPIDFASMLFAIGKDPRSYHNEQAGFCKEIGIEPAKYRRHHALDDARLLREVYLKMFPVS